MTKAEQFIQRHHMDYRMIDLEAQLPIYLEEMQKGLDGEQSSLLMLPSFLCVTDGVQLGKPVVCVDAGGTNLRVTAACFTQNGTFETRDIARYVMPGVERELSAQEFFDALAGYIAPFCAFSKNIVISFAYRAKTTPGIDSEIIEITKEVKVRGAEGKLLAEEIGASLAKMGIQHANIIVINDSVATALSGKAEYLNRGYGAFTGTILGTGSNSCYMESNQNIGKLPGLPDGTMVINTEAGSYNKMPRSDIDIAFDGTLQNPGVGLAEKMTSGAYLGALCAFTLKQAAQEDVFQTKAVEGLRGLKSEDVSVYLADGSGLVAEFMANEEDGQNARELLHNIVHRAARMAALQMAAMALKSCRCNNRVCMTIEGSTYEKMYGLKQELLNTLIPFLEKKGVEADVVELELSVLKGCAIAGLSR